MEANLDQNYIKAIEQLRKKYYTQVTNDLQKQFNIKNVLGCPKITHIILSKGLSTAPGKIIDPAQAMKNLSNIACQKVMPVAAKKSVSQFKISKGRINGCKVTLRRNNMYFFLEKLINLYFVGKRNFNGIKHTSFNVQKKNICISFGVDDERIFPEITTNATSNREGFNVTIVTNANKLEHIKYLLNHIGIPIMEK